MTSEKWRAAAKIDGNIQNGALRYAHQFGLRLNGLIVNAANYVAVGNGEIILHPVSGQAIVFKTLQVPCFMKGSAIIAEDIRCNKPNARQLGFDHLHNPLSSAAG